MSLLVNIADAVVVVLNGHAFSQAFTARRACRLSLDRGADLATLQVVAIPDGMAWELASRAKNQRDYGVQLVFLKAITPAGNMETEVPVLLTLVEEVADHMRAYPLAALSAQCIKVAMAPAAERGYIAEHLDEHRQFASALDLTFRVYA